MVSEYVCPPDHKHAATQTCGRNHGCRCRPCRDAHAAEMRRRRRLVKAGLTYARRPSLGVRRRLEALMAVGWSRARLADMLGVSRRAPHHWLNSKWTTPRVYGQVDRLYQELWNQKPPTETMPDRVSFRRTIEHARRHGYHPPMAWDDIDRDPEPPKMTLDAARKVVDHVAVDLLLEGRLTRDQVTYYERRAAAQEALRRGWTRNRIIEHVGIQPRQPKRAA